MVTAQQQIARNARNRRAAEVVAEAAAEVANSVAGQIASLQAQIKAVQASALPRIRLDRSGGANRFAVFAANKARQIAALTAQITALRPEPIVIEPEPIVIKPEPIIPVTQITPLPQIGDITPELPKITPQNNTLRNALIVGGALLLIL